MTTRNDIARPGTGIAAVPGQVDDATLDRIASSLLTVIPGAAGPELAIASAVTGACTRTLTLARLGGPGSARGRCANSRRGDSGFAHPDAAIHRAFAPAPTSATAAAIQTAIAVPVGGESWPASIPTLAEFPLNPENMDGSLPRMFDDAGASAAPAASDGAPSYYFLTPVLATLQRRPPTARHSRGAPLMSTRSGAIFRSFRSGFMGSSSCGSTMRRRPRNRMR